MVTVDRWTRRPTRRDSNGGRRPIASPGRLASTIRLSWAARLRRTNGRPGLGRRPPIVACRSARTAAGVTLLTGTPVRWRPVKSTDIIYDVYYDQNSQCYEKILNGRRIVQMITSDANVVVETSDQINHIISKWYYGKIIMQCVYRYQLKFIINDFKTANFRCLHFLCIILCALKI